MERQREVDQQWTFEPSIFEPKAKATPSACLHGIPWEDELQSRKKTVTYMRSLAYRTNLIHMNDSNSHLARGVIMVGAIMMQRFYMRRSLKDFPEALTAATFFFLASKIEEQPVKLRAIVNACLAKFEGLGTEEQWDPHQPANPLPSKAYTRWENDILATEEIALEALCFDMSVIQPWVLFQRYLSGLDACWLGPQGSTRLTEGVVAQVDKSAEDIESSRILSENNISEIGWPIFNELSLTPIFVMFPARILAFSVLVIILAMLDQKPISGALRMAAGIAWKFGFNEEELGLSPDFDARGTLKSDIEDCIKTILSFSRSGLVDSELVQCIQVEPAEPEKGPWKPVFKGQPGTQSQSASVKRSHDDSFEDNDKGKEELVSLKRLRAENGVIRKSPPPGEGNTGDKKGDFIRNLDGYGVAPGDKGEDGNRSVGKVGSESALQSDTRETPTASREIEELPPRSPSVSDLDIPRMETDSEQANPQDPHEAPKAGSRKGSEGLEHT